jgi:hypothetical protein
VGPRGKRYLCEASPTPNPSPEGEGLLIEALAHRRNHQVAATAAAALNTATAR